MFVPREFEEKPLIFLIFNIISNTSINTGGAEANKRGEV
jgi:hypothetical protein